MFNSRTKKKVRPKATRYKKLISDILPEKQVIKLRTTTTTEAESRSSSKQLTLSSSLPTKNHTTSKSSSQIALALVTLGWWSSLNAPLRSILNGFYYLAAIISLFLLIAYFHQVKAQHQQQHQQQQHHQQHHQQQQTIETYKMVQEILQLASDSSSTQVGIAQVVGPIRLRRDPPRINSTPVSGTKTANRSPQVFDAKSTTGLATKATPVSSSKRPALPELTFRVANDQAENNRGSRHRSIVMANQFNETQPLLASNSQWTPIMHNNNNIPKRQSVRPLPQQPTSLNSGQAQQPNNYIPGPTVSNGVMPMVAAPSIEFEIRHRDQPAFWNGGNSLHHELENYNHHHNSYNHHQNNNRPIEATYRTFGHDQVISGQLRNWRRPRLNGGYHRQSKMYKRVLICDKTLVSLDYLRDYGAEPRPTFPMAHYSFGDSSVLESSHNLVDDNSIDLDLNGGPGVDLLDRRASTQFGNITINAIDSSTSLVSTPLPTPTTTTTTSTTTTTTTTTPTAMPINGQHNSDKILTAPDTIIERRSGYQYNLLPEDDALVKCDMWDLEKGLKNRKPPLDILDLAVKADFDTVRDAINRCRQLTEKTLPPDDEYRDGLDIMSSEDFVSLFSMKRGLLPGTKWCGLGDQASTYNDLGPKHRIDICCRAHDHCPIRLKPFRNDYGVLNIALYTKSHCDCDADFYRCLREAHSRTADMLGNLYFNVMKLQCIREERLKVCREVRPIALGFERCVRYEENPKRRVFKFTTPPVAY